MNAPLQAVSPQAGAKPALSPLMVRIVGKALSTRKINTQDGALWLTMVALEAPDRFTAPGFLELQSKSKIAHESGEDIDVLGRLGGRRRSYKTTTEDGDARTVQTASNTVTVIGEA